MLQHLNTLIGFAAVFAILSLLVTSVTQVIRTLGKLNTRTLIERLLRLFGELEDPDRFVAAILAHPTLEGQRGWGHYEALTDSRLDRSAVQCHVAAVLGRGCATSRLGWLRPWPRTNDLDKQAIKDIGQSVYEAIGHLVDRPIPEPGSESKAAQRWAQALKRSLDDEDDKRLSSLSSEEGQEEAVRSSRVPQLTSAVAPFRGKMWMLAASAFPEAEGQAPPLKTYVAAFHDEAQASASDAFTLKIRWVTVFVAALLSFFLQLDAVAVWQRMAKTDSAQLSRLQAAATTIELNLAKAAPTSGPQVLATSAQVSELSKAADQITAAATALESAGFDLKWLPDGTGWLFKEKAHLFGFLLAVAALSLGAPFWFELLKSAIQMKSAFTRERTG